MIKMIFNKKTNKKSYIKSNKGMTMVEVIMGFVVLITFLAGMSGVISFSSNLLMRSIDLKKDLQVIQGELYKKNLNCHMSDGGLILSFEVKENNITVSKEINLSHAKVYEVDSNDLSGISEEGLDIIIYGVGSDTMSSGTP